MSYKRKRAKIRHKRDVLDEWEWADIDRDEQEAGLKRRAQRWKEIKREVERQKMLERKAVQDADKMPRTAPRDRQPTPLEEAWLRCDYVLFNMMTMSAYQMMEWCRTNDVEAYKHLYKIFMSRNMMENIQTYVDFFAQGGKTDRKIKKEDVIRHYLRYKGYKPKIMVERDGRRREFGKEE